MKQNNPLLMGVVAGVLILGLLFAFGVFGSDKPDDTQSNDPSATDGADTGSGDSEAGSTDADSGA